MLRLNQQCHWPTNCRISVATIFQAHTLVVKASSRSGKIHTICSITQDFILIEVDKGSSTFDHVMIIILHMINIFWLEGLARSLPSLTPAPSLHPPASPSKYRCCHKFHEYITWKWHNIDEIHFAISSFCVKILNCHSNRILQASSLFPSRPTDRRSHCLHCVQKSLWGNTKNHHHRKKSKYQLPKITGYWFSGNRGCSQNARQRPNWTGWLQGEYVKRTCVHVQKMFCKKAWNELHQAHQGRKRYYYDPDLSCWYNLSG